MEIKLDKQRPPLKSIIDAWHTKCAEIRLSQAGTPMPIIPPSRMLESLKILAKTLRGHGFTYDEIDSTNVSILIVNTCWKEDKIRKMSNIEVRKAKKNLSDDWDSVIHSSEFSGIEIAELNEDEKIVITEKNLAKPAQKLPELNPSDRIKMDTSDMSETPLDDEFLADMASVGTILKDDNE